MGAIGYRIGDLLDKMRDAGLSQETVTRFAGAFDRERFHREEQRGARDTVAWELRLLTDFLLERVLPIASSVDPFRSRADAEAELESFVHSNMSDVTLSHEIMCTAFVQNLL